MTDDTRKNGNIELSCDIVRDLLPLYHDGVVSDATKAAVESHLAACGDCRGENDTYNTKFPEEQPPEEEIEITTAEQFAKTVRKNKKRVRKRLITSVLIVVFVFIFAGAAIFLTQVPYVNKSEAYKALAVYRLETEMGTCYYVAHEQRSYTCRYCIQTGDDSFEGQEEIYDEYAGVTIPSSLVWNLNMYYRCPILTWWDTDAPRWGISNMYFFDCDIAEIKFNGETVWTKEENEDDEVPGYVYEQYEIWYGENRYLDVEEKWIYEDDTWYIRFTYPDGTVNTWDIDGNYIADRSSAK